MIEFRCVYINYAFKILFRRKQSLYIQYTDPLNVVINLKNLVVKLTCGNYSGKYSKWKISQNFILNVVFFYIYELYQCAMHVVVSILL